MAVDFSKFDKSIDLEGLKNDIAESSANTGDFKEVPVGTYEVAITKLELVVSKKGDPMVSCWMKILEGEFKGSLLFMNQVVTQGFQVHLVNKFLRALTENTGINVEFESYAQYSTLIDNIFAEIEETREYLVAYTQNKGYSNFEITETYIVE